MPDSASAKDFSFDSGVLFYQNGQYDAALVEFEKALAANPFNSTAKQYIQVVKESKDLLDGKISNIPSRKGKTAALDQDQILPQEMNAFEQKYLNELKDKKTSSSQIANKSEKTLITPIEESSEFSKSLDPYIDQRSLLAQDTYMPEEKIEEAIIETNSDVSISGELRMGFGYDTRNNDFIWKRANFDLNEKNWRIISWDQLNNRSNTYDPAIFDRLSFTIDADPEESRFSYHANITIDPWSFTGTTQKVTLQGAGGDSVDVQFYFWANNGYTVNNNVYTLQNGDMVALPEFKVNGSTLPGGTLTSKFSNTFAFPEMKIHNYFWPLREFWVNYEPTDSLTVQVFPYALEDKALSSDDPLGLSNNHIWWEESPWLANWAPGHINTGATPVDFMKGYWDDDLAFQVRDSDGKRLTALRGFSVNLIEDDTEMQFVLASPKTLWQDYDSFDALPASLRIKHFVSDNLYIGMTDNIHLGFVDKEKVDAYNVVVANDIGLLLNPGLLVKAEHAMSSSAQDRSFIDYDTKSQGHAYDLSIIGTINGIDSPDANYFSIRPDEEDKHFFKTRLRMTRMDKGFESSLANYHETRKDQFWSRHLTFREPIAFGEITYDDIEPFAIGNSIDYGRYVIDWRTDSSFWDGRLEGLTDIRNAHQTSTNKYIETVARTEWSLQATDRLQTKVLLLAHHLPKTIENVDPYITTKSGAFITNTSMPGGKDPSAYTGSLGLKYDLTKQLSWNGTWEYTNDFMAGSDNFPRGIMTDSSMSTYQSYGMIYRETYSYLYGQGAFPLPPYDYHNVFRTGLDFQPNEKWDIYLDYTRNPYEYAGPIDDNMNHVGCAITYMPTPKIGLFAKYMWSRIKDVNDVVFNPNDIKFKTHHNVFLEARYLFTDESKLSFSYGVGPSIHSAYASSTPYLGSTTPTLDTQSIFRVFYTKEL